MTPHGFTCLIPAYNEASRIGGVLDAVRQHPLLAEVIVIDDGSTDGTAAVAQGLGARVIATGGNHGKTRALARGLGDCRTSHVVLLDADLLGLTAADVTALIVPVREGRVDATLSLRGNAPGLWRLIGLDYISGERVIPRAMLDGHGPQLHRLPRFGFEVYLNRLLISTGARVAVVDWPHVASPSKASKRGLWQGLRADAAMLADMFRTIPLVEAISQIHRLRRRIRVDRAAH